MAFTLPAAALSTGTACTRPYLRGCRAPRHVAHRRRRPPLVLGQQAHATVQRGGMRQQALAGSRQPSLVSVQQHNTAQRHTQVNVWH